MKLLKILIFLIILVNLVFLGYFVSITGNVVKETRVLANVTRIIDGDTFESNLGTVRLLGINNKSV